MLNKYSYNLKEKERSKFKCENEGCNTVFLTKKNYYLLIIKNLYLNIILLELIGEVKKIINNKNLINYLDIIKKKFNKIMKNISLDEHTQIITGLTFN